MERKIFDKIYNNLWFTRGAGLCLSSCSYVELIVRKTELRQRAEGSVRLTLHQRPLWPTGDASASFAEQKQML